jgi:flagellar basal-body rod modification protein FlgD
MQVNSVNTSKPGATDASSQATGTSTSANYDAFLQLLVTEVKNQDPTKPMDPTQTVTQLATFSQVEQAIQANSKLDSIVSNSILSQASTLVGRTITLQDGSASGKVVSVTTSSSGLSATLDNGSVVNVTTGLTVS